MDLIATIVLGVMIVLVVMTAIAEPVASWSYGKAVVKSSVKLWTVIIDTVDKVVDFARVEKDDN